ncbi:hypothetical protein NL519_39040, partial [Klebsiella pneumoniae]|nr:hypothetical protein [Klebsiella pneumoniae]
YKWDIECNTLSQLRKDVKDLRTNILTKTNLTGQLNDVNQKIASIERSSHASILAIYQKTLNQVNAINHFATKNIAFLED